MDGWSCVVYQRWSRLINFNTYAKSEILIKPSTSNTILNIYMYRGDTVHQTIMCHVREMALIISFTFKGWMNECHRKHLHSSILATWTVRKISKWSSKTILVSICLGIVSLQKDMIILVRVKSHIWNQRVIAVALYDAFIVCVLGNSLSSFKLSL